MSLRESVVGQDDDHDTASCMDAVGTSEGSIAVEYRNDSEFAFEILLNSTINICHHPQAFSTFIQSRMELDGGGRRRVNDNRGLWPNWGRQTQLPLRDLESLPVPIGWI